MENRVEFGIKEENGKWFVWKNESIDGGTWSYPRTIGEPLNTKEEAEEELEYQRWYYWYQRFNELIGETPVTLYDLTAEQLRELVIELGKEFSSPKDINWAERNPAFDKYVDIMKKHNAL